MTIIGGGAAGLATAIFLRRARPDLPVTILDGARKLGAKILVAGGGRCNVTNARVIPADYYGGNRNILKRTLRAFSAADARAFFEELGVRLHEEEHGKLFPDSNSARTVLAALLDEAARRGVRIETGQRVERIGRRPDGFEIETAAGTRTARRVVLATGGMSLPKTGSDGGGYRIARALGHSIVPTTPALDPLILDSDWHGALQGITHDVTLEIRVTEERPVRITGSLLWTHFGISGPVALNLSRFWNRARLEQRRATVTANLLDGQAFEEADTWLRAADPRTGIARVLRERLPQRIADLLCGRAVIGTKTPVGQVPRESRRQLVHLLTALPLPITRSRGYRYAEVTAGGVPLSEIEAARMHSRCCPGLFLVGEILDIDGRIGGFNFQWAWASGHVAARGIATAPD